jgi:hypothetical protein
MRWDKLAEGIIGFYLLIPGPEDIATGGITLGPSALFGAILLADAFSIDLSKWK